MSEATTAKSHCSHCVSPPQHAGRHWSGQERGPEISSQFHRQQALPGTRCFRQLAALAFLAFKALLAGQPCWTLAASAFHLPQEDAAIRTRRPPYFHLVTVGEETHYYNISEQLHLFQEGFASPVSHFPQHSPLYPHPSLYDEGEGTVRVWPLLAQVVLGLLILRKHARIGPSPRLFSSLAARLNSLSRVTTKDFDSRAMPLHDHGIRMYCH